MIEIRNLHKAFGDKKVLSGVNLTVDEGIIFSVIGKSGTGKSVLLKSILGLLTPDDGEITVDGINTKNFRESDFNKKIRPKAAMVFQEGALWDSMTIEENIDLALQIQKHFSKEERKKLIDKSLELVELENINDTYPEELSGGMMKRVAIARAIAMKPKYLLYDEPTTGLDPVLSNVINALIKKLNDELNITSLIISHDITGVEQISDKVGMLYKGEIITVCDAKKMWEVEDKIFHDFIRGKIELR